MQLSCSISFLWENICLSHCAYFGSLEASSSPAVFQINSYIQLHKDGDLCLGPSPIISSLLLFILMDYLFCFNQSFHRQKHSMKLERMHFRKSAVALFYRAFWWNTFQILLLLISFGSLLSASVALKAFPKTSWLLWSCHKCISTASSLGVSGFISCCRLCLLRSFAFNDT